MAHALRTGPGLWPKRRNFYVEYLLFRPPHNQDNEHATTARQAAEALFVPKQENDTLFPAPESAVARKPRILAALPRARPDPAITAVSPNQETRRRAIPKSRVDRIRTWLRYGMTVHQAADTCGVSVTEIKRALR